MPWGRSCRRATLATALLIAATGSAQAEPASLPLETSAIKALATQIVASGDTHGRPFLIVDKVAAQVVAFDADGTVRGGTPALLGAARGDVPPAGIGSRPLAQIGPADRITQAGRFEARIGRDLHEDVLWIDYDTGLSLHRVVTTSRIEHRLTRLATPTPDDNRVSFGCINVPRIFYETVVAPLFRPADGIVYILPEQHTPGETFPTLRLPSAPRS
ncbi:L,D-transpeptidase [Sphingomonas sp. PvP056]|uniref:L,D-transpeptidase n=1 Tax=Sphingomonas sp. PvP056 TaxID=3156392 RepID=UPI0033972BA8